ISPDLPEVSSSELARNELWVHPISAVLLSAKQRTVRLAIGGSEPMDWCIREVHLDWFRADTSAGLTVIAQISQVDWVSVGVIRPGPKPDIVAPKFRGALSEASRRRIHVKVVSPRGEFTGRIHHVGADYVQLTRPGGESVVLPVSQIAWVEFGGPERA
ncbi:MAG: hypothetical protein ACKOXM_01905, partial [Agromyces sp.]